MKRKTIEACKSRSKLIVQYIYYDSPFGNAILVEEENEPFDCTVGGFDDVFSILDLVSCLATLLVLVLRKTIKQQSRF